MNNPENLKNCESIGGASRSGLRKAGAPSDPSTFGRLGADCTTFGYIWASSSSSFGSPGINYTTFDYIWPSNSSSFGSLGINYATFGNVFPNDPSILSLLDAIRVIIMTSGQLG